MLALACLSGCSLLNKPELPRQPEAPVAGQGLNLGLRDAFVLARLLAHGTTPAALQQFGALRQNDRALTVRMTDTLARIFTGAAPAQTLLGAALGLVDIVPPARHLLAEMMMFGRR